MIGLFIFIIVIIVGFTVVGWLMSNTDKITNFLDKAADKAIDAVSEDESVPNLAMTNPRADPRY